MLHNSVRWADLSWADLSGATPTELDQTKRNKTNSANKCQPVDLADQCVLAGHGYKSLSSILPANMYECNWYFSIKFTAHLNTNYYYYYYQFNY